MWDTVTRPCDSFGMLRSVRTQELCFPRDDQAETWGHLLSMGATDKEMAEKKTGACPGGHGSEQVKKTKHAPVAPRPEWKCPLSLPSNARTSVGRSLSSAPSTPLQMYTVLQFRLSPLHCLIPKVWMPLKNFLMALPALLICAVVYAHWAGRGERGSWHTGQSS